MEDCESVLMEKHAIPLLIYVMRNEGCLMGDLQENVTTNYVTVRRLCEKFFDIGLMEDRNVRERKLITRYYLTEKGVTVALLLRYVMDVAKDPDFDLTLMVKQLQVHFGDEADKAYDIPEH